MGRDFVLTFLRENRENIRERYGVMTIGLFGSFARGDEREDSDIDIAVNFDDRHSDIKNYVGLQEFLEKGLGRKIDLGVERAFKPILRRYIEKEIMYV